MSDAAYDELDEDTRAYLDGRWCGECRYGVVESPPCCTQPAPPVPVGSPGKED